MRLVRPLLLLLAVAVVAASSATAASMITGSQIKNGTVTGADIKNRSLTGVDIKDQAVGARDIKDGAVQFSTIAPDTAEQLQSTPASTRVVATAATDPRMSITPPLTARCPDGQVATGGGGQLSDRRASGTGLIASVPELDAAGTPVGWTVVLNRGSEPRELVAEVFAVCSPGQAAG